MKDAPTCHSRNLLAGINRWIPAFAGMTPFIFLAITLLVHSPALADDDGYEFESKAAEAHKIASSDMIYQNEEWKAIYYQNQSIIQLLKQIRDSLEVIKSRDGLKNTENSEGQ